MQDYPVITTIIPTYRRPHLLKRAIKSALNQTFKNLQVCVYDNASGDETREIVESLAKEDKRVKYFCHDVNIGSQKNFRFGLDKVDSQYFSFLSDDDFLFPEFYEMGIKNLQKFSDAALFVGNCIECSSKLNILKIGLKEDQREGLYSPNESVNTFIFKTFVPWTSIIFNASKVKKYELADSFKISDVDYLMKIMYNESIVVSKKYCAVFLANYNSISTNLDLNDLWPIMGQIMERAEKSDVISDKIKKDAALRCRRYMIEWLYSRGLKSILLNDKEKFSKAAQILENDFDMVDKASKLKFFYKIKILSVIGPFVLKLRRGCLYILNKRFYFHKKSLLGLVKTLN